VKTIAGFTLGSLITAILLISYASYDTLRSIDRD
jgi:hypothetical protein